MIIGFVGGKEIFVKSDLAIADWGEVVHFEDYAGNSVVVVKDKVAYLRLEKK